MLVAKNLVEEQFCSLRLRFIEKILGSLIFNDGWFSGVTAGTAKTNYSETTQTWLWLTSPSEDAVVQLPLKSIEYYQFLIFR